MRPVLKIATEPGEALDSRYLASTLLQAHRQAADVHEQVERLLGLAPASFSCAAVKCASWRVSVPAAASSSLLRRCQPQAGLMNPSWWSC